MKIFKKILLIVLILFLFSNLVFWVNLFTGYNKYANVSYGDKSEEIMDIYIPRSAKNNPSNGCILFIHGGSWSGGSKEEETLRCRNYASKGYITATISYSLYSSENASTFNVDLILNQITSAFEKIIQLCKEQKVSVDKCATSGYSAGAHLSMLYSFSKADECPLKIMFTANLAGPSDLTYKTWKESSYNLVHLLTGKKVTQEMIDSGEAEELANLISPTFYVDENTVPSIFAYGGKDNTVRIENGIAIKERFDAFNLEYKYVYFPHSNHAMATDLHKRFAYYKAITSYAKKYFNY